MILCSSCQHELPDNSHFCGYCGAKVEAPELKTASAESEENKTYESVKQTEFNSTPSSSNVYPSDDRTEGESAAESDDDPSAPVDTPKVSVNATMQWNATQIGLDVATLSKPLSERSESAEDDSKEDFLAEDKSDSEEGSSHDTVAELRPVERVTASDESPSTASISSMELDLANGDVKSTTDDSPSAASISSMELDLANGDVKSTTDDSPSAASISSMELDLANGDVKSTTDDSPSSASISSMDLADDDDDEDIRELERLLAERKARKKNKRSAVDNENARSNSSDECSKLEVDLAGLDKTPETASASASAESAASTGEDTSRTTAAESMVTPNLKEEVRKTSEVPKENESGSAERESNSKPNDILNTEAGGKLDTEGKPVSSNKDAETSEVCEAEMIEDSTENLTDKSKGDGAKRNKKRRQRWVNDNRSSPQKSATDEIETEASPANEAQTSETEREESERRAQAEALKKLDEAARKSKRETEGDSFEVVGMASSSMDDAKTEVKANERKADAVDDDEEFGEFGEFDDSNEMDFFNGRMSSQFEVATEMFDTQKKKGNKTTIVLVGILAVVVLVIVAIVII